MRIDDVVRIQGEPSIRFRIFLKEGVFVETVLFENRRGLRLCISTQAGCNMGCYFCATGLEWNRHNLTVDEIAGQVSLVLDYAGLHHTQIASVTMAGMGEPLANYHNTMGALELLSDLLGPDTLSFSTVGITPMIKRMIREAHARYRLYLSLHSPWQAVRESIMPIARHFPIDDLLDVVSEYASSHRTGEVRISYLMLEEVNDREGDIEELVRLLSGRNLPVQILLWNEVDGLRFRRVPEGRALSWVDRLNKAGIEAYAMPSEGRRIRAACGQLMAKRPPVTHLLTAPN